MAYESIIAIPAANVGNGQTLAFTLPYGLQAADFLTSGAELLLQSGDKLTGSNITVALSGATATVTNNTSTVIPKGSRVLLQLPRAKAVVRKVLATPQAAYDALAVKDPDTLYVIVG